MTGTLKEEGSLGKETQRRAPFEDGGRDWGDVSTSQGIPRVAISQQKAVESRKHPSREASERAGPWFQASGLQICQKGRLFMTD